jgi:hypothetical protein
MSDLGICEWTVYKVIELWLIPTGLKNDNKGIPHWAVFCWEWVLIFVTSIKRRVSLAPQNHYPHEEILLFHYDLDFLFSSFLGWEWCRQCFFCLSCFQHTHQEDSSRVFKNCLLLLSTIKEQYLQVNLLKDVFHYMLTIHLESFFTFSVREV